MQNDVLKQLMNYAPECCIRGDTNALEELFHRPQTQDYLNSLLQDNGTSTFLLAATVSNCMQTAIQQGMDPDQVYDFSLPYIQKACHSIPRNEILHAIMQVSLAFAELHSHWNHSQASHIAPRVKNYISSHLTEKIRIKEIAATLGMAESTLHIAFKRETGTTIYDTILQAKMERAMFLLQYAGISIAETAYQLAFSSQSHFTAKFREYYGYTPKQVRKAP